MSDGIAETLDVLVLEPDLQFLLLFVLCLLEVFLRFRDEFRGGQRLHHRCFAASGKLLPQCL